jgi:AcrR family transcriptional regulator
VPEPSDAPRKRPRQPRARATVDAILLATAQLLRTDGPARLTTNRIAERAGVSIGSLYQYFPNKRAVLAELRAQHGRWFEDAIRAEMERDWRRPLREAVRSGVTEMVAMHRAGAGLHRALANGERALGGELEAELRGRLEAFLAERAAELRPLDRELASFIAVRALEAVIHGAAVDAPERLHHPAFVDEVSELLLGYLGA